MVVLGHALLQCRQLAEDPTIKELGISVANLRVHRLHDQHLGTAGSTQNRARTENAKIPHASPQE
jgi:hypothetical protein